MGDRMKKVLFVISSLGVGGAQRALAEITKHLPEDWKIDILLNGRQPIEFEYRGNLLFLGMDKKPNMSSILFHAKLLYKRVAMLRKLKKSGRYDACISFLDSANVANILTKNAKCKTIISARSTLSKQAKMPQYKYIVNPLAKILYNQADCIVAVSNGVRRDLVEQFGLAEEKVVVIENGYDIARMQMLGEQGLNADESSFLQNRRVVINVGRLSDAKAQWHLLRAFADVAAKIDDAVLVIVGGGELETYLRKVAARLGITDRVLFTGYSKNPYKYLRRSDVFVLPSLYEGFPNALAEAMCMGVPCIATDFQFGARELLAPALVESENVISTMAKLEYGIITPCCSGKRLVGEDLEPEERTLADSICEMLVDDNTHRHYTEMSKLRSKDLGIERVVEKYESIIC